MRRMRKQMLRAPSLIRLGLGVACALLLASSASLLAERTPQARTGGPRFTITFPASAHAGPITGRVYVAISKTNDRTPIQQADTTGVPLFGVNIDALAPGAPATIDATTLGYPVKSLKDLPAGDYWAQAFVNVYTKFARADGHTVLLNSRGPQR